MSSFSSHRYREQWRSPRIWKSLIISLPLDSPIRWQCDQNNQGRHNRSKFGRSSTFSKQRSLLSYLAENGNEKFIAPLLETGKLLSGFKDEDVGRSPLLWPAQNGHEAIVKS
ncbi:hypothetical protein DER44DRAFT_800011 [Fusarium oxysporum]|nr:hypothetical protein DER44DRAFT_800011 [Fusarium oxysporum]